MPMIDFYNLMPKLQIGDRVIVPKSAFNLVQHHAIYIGQENGIHYLIENKEGIGVRVVPANLFFKGVSVVTRIESFSPMPGYSRLQLQQYALSKKGTPYHLANYNCEHFANEIQHGHVDSGQVNNVKSLLAAAATVLLIGGLFSSFE